MTSPLTGTVIVTETNRTEDDVFNECTAVECDNGRLEIIRAADGAKLASYAPDAWSYRIDDGRTLVSADHEEEDDDES